ncbi:MAG: PKD domain-containing protein [Fimbriimonadales bacterium]
MLLSFVIATTLAGANPQAAEIQLYTGAQVDGSATKIAAWGGGTIKEDHANAFRNGHSLQITTTSMFNGGLVSFGSPVKLASMVSNPENMLSATFYIVGNTDAGNTKKNIENIRMLIRTSDGKLSEAVLPVGLGYNRWKPLGIPLNKVSGFSKTNMEISSISFGADAPGMIYVGEVRAVNDKSSIQGRTEKMTMTMARDQETLFVGAAEAGSTICEYVWDWDAKDGLQEDAIGQAVYHRFRVGGDYVVTLTVRDKYGVKKPWTGTIKVTVWQ